MTEDFDLEGYMNKKEAPKPAAENAEAPNAEAPKTESSGTAEGGGDGERSDAKRSRSRSRDRRDRDRGKGRDRDRDRDRDKDKDKDKDKDRDRDRDRDRSRKDRDRDRDRSRSGRDRRDRDRDRDRERDREPLTEEQKQQKQQEKELMDLTKDQRTVFVSQLTQKVKEKHLKKYFTKCGKVKNIYLMRNKMTGRSKGFAYVEMQDLESIPLVLLLTNQRPDFQKFPIMIKASEAEKNFIRKQEKASMDPSGEGMAMIGGVSIPGNANRLYVGNLHVNITEEDLRTVFASFGEIQQVQLHCDEAGRSKGYAFVHFQEVTAAQTAMSKVNGLELAGKAIKIGLVNESTQGGGQGGAQQGSWKLDDDEGTGMQMNAQSRAMLMQRLGGGGAGDSGGNMGMTGSNMVPVAQMPPKPSGPVGLPAAAAAALASGQKPKITGSVSHAFLLKNMFDPATETEPDWDKEIKEDVVAECKGNVLHAYVEKDLPGGMVYLLFDQTSDAEAAAEGMNGRWFAGRMITVRYLARQEHCAKFPETKEMWASLQ